MNVRCIKVSTLYNGIEYDTPFLTKGKIYTVVENNIPSMNQPDEYISVIGDNNQEIIRHRSLFTTRINSRKKLACNMQKWLNKVIKRKQERKNHENI